VFLYFQISAYWREILELYMEWFELRPSGRCVKSIDNRDISRSMGEPRAHRPLPPPTPIIRQYNAGARMKYERAAMSGPFGHIRSDSVDSRINLRPIAHRKDDAELAMHESPN